MNNDRFRFRQLVECEKCGYKDMRKSRMIDVSLLSPYAPYNGCPKCGASEIDMIDYAIEQCVGLKDKHDVLIFAGDILGVLFSDGTYDKYEVTPPTSEYPAWDLKGFPDVDCNAFSWIYNSPDIEEIEVVGNIHEEK